MKCSRLKWEDQSIHSAQAHQYEKKDRILLNIFMDEQIAYIYNAFKEYFFFFVIQFVEAIVKICILLVS